MPIYPHGSSRGHLRKRWGLQLWVIEDDRGEEFLFDRLRGDILERWSSRERIFFGFPHEGWKILGFVKENGQRRELALHEVEKPNEIIGWTIIDLDHGTARHTGKVKGFHPAPDWWVQQTMNKLQRLPLPKSWFE